MLFALVSSRLSCPQKARACGLILISDEGESSLYTEEGFFFLSILKVTNAGKGPAPHHKPKLLL